MIEVKNAHSMGFVSAIYGMRNPLNSWDRYDSNFDDVHFVMGQNDKDLACILIQAGASHRKFLRQIMISCTITAPLYWWKEMDQYKVSTTTNSCSTMHKIHSRELTIDDFSHEHLEGLYLQSLNSTILMINDARSAYLESKDKSEWWNMIQLLPSSYNQMRTLTMSYETALNILETRRGHKLDEWNLFREELLKLPYMEMFYTAQSEGSMK